MANKRMKPCALCGTLYEYCNACNEDMDKPIWMNTFCSKECLSSYETMVSYVNKQTSKGDAKIILMGYQNSGKYKNYKKSFAEVYNEIMSEKDPDTVEEEMKTQEQVVEEIQKDIAEETAKEIVANATKESKKFYPKSVAHKKG